MDQYTLFGNPVSHSYSPFVHAQFAAETNQKLEYTTILVPLDRFSESVAAFRADGGKGANVTLPFKEEAWALCDELTDRASLAKAVNTLIWRADGSLLGDNTDGLGLVADLQRSGVELTGLKILVLGAGGAVRGVLQPLLQQNPHTITIANRTVAKAELLADEFGTLGHIDACGFDEIKGSFELIINGTSASLSGAMPSMPADILKHGAITYDMAYGPKATVFQQWGEQQGGGKNLAGLGMLVNQAAFSFAAWRGVMPQVQPVCQRLLEKIRESQ